VCELDREFYEKDEFEVPELTKGIFEIEFESMNFKGVQIVLDQ
jgi:hypothetical protein